MFPELNYDQDSIYIDSLTKGPVIFPIKRSDELFRTNYLAVQHKEYIPKAKQTYDWQIGIIVLILFLFAIVQFSYNKVVKNIVDLVIYNQLSVQQIRNENVFIRSVMYILSFNFVLTISLLIYQVATLIYHVPITDSTEGFMLFVKLFLGVGIFVLGKMLVVRFLGSIFEVSKLTSDYLFNIFVFHTVINVSLLPVIIGIAYLHPKLNLFHFGVIIFVLISLFAIFRGIILTRSAIRLSYFYMFLYLCTVEFLPLLFIYNYIIKN